MVANAITVQEQFKPHSHDIIVIGSGPVGIHFIQKLRQLNEKLSIAIFGDEPWEPYNRVKLSSLLTGEISEDSIYQSMDITSLPMVRCFYNSRVTHINRYNKTIRNNQGEIHSYKNLIIATGSSPRIPNIEGINLKNIYTFRHLNDAVKLMGRSVRTRRTIIIGGGLLGLEAARAMQRFNTEVIVIEHSMWLMFNQLDHHSGSFLKHYIQSLNIEVRTNDSVKSINGHDAVQSITLSSGETIDCDTVIFATGIKPNIDLAIDAELHFNKGIRINDQLQTNDLNIHAIGECSEHRNTVYGLVAPGFEQADVLAHIIHGKNAHYAGTVTATNLKVLDYPVFSMGNIGVNAREREMIIFHDNQNEIYRKIIIINGKIRGVIAIGSWPGVSRIQQLVNKQARIWPWQVSRFRKTGTLWSEDDSENVSNWPNTAIICNCTGVTKGTLVNAQKTQCNTIAEIAKHTGASTVCGTCKPMLAQLVGSKSTLEPVKNSASLLSISITSLILLLIFLSLPGIRLAETVQTSVNWDQLWTNSLYKQISGFSLLGISLLISTVSLRKRIKVLHKLWDYAGWRLIHVIAGLVLIGVLLVHTGFNFGNHLNLYLMLIFSGTMLAGVILGGVISIEHLISHKAAKQTRLISLWIHILLIWPLPVLLCFHILKTYYF